MAKHVLYLCDHKYNCANSLFCELNGGDCKHTSIAAHSRNHSFTHTPEKDPRFKPIRTGQYYDDYKIEDDICYIEKEDIFAKIAENVVNDTINTLGGM